MAQPTTYARAFNFAQYQTQSPFDPLPGVQVDTEYDRIRQTTDEIITNLNLIQRDDGQLENRSVGRDQIKTDLLTDFQLLTPTRVKQFVYDATNTVNEYQELAVNQTDFDDAYREYSVIGPDRRVKLYGALGRCQNGQYRSLG
jgi:hypothetical protein